MNLHSRRAMNPNIQYQQSFQPKKVLISHQGLAKRDVNLSIGGQPVGKRIDLFNNDFYQKTYCLNPKNQFSIVDTRVNNQYSQFNQDNYIQYKTSNSQFHDAFYDANKTRGIVQHNEKEQYLEGYQDYQENEKKVKRRQKTCKEKICCCHPLLCLLLALLALAAITLGLLFALGILGNKEPEPDPNTSIDGVSYFSNSITVQQKIVERYQDSQPDFHSGQTIQPIKVNPVNPPKIKDDNFVDPIAVQPMLPSSHVIRGDSIYNAPVNPIKIIPTRDVNLNTFSNAQIAPQKWTPNPKYSGFFSKNSNQPSGLYSVDPTAIDAVSSGNQRFQAEPIAVTPSIQYIQKNNIQDAINSNAFGQVQPITVSPSSLYSNNQQEVSVEPIKWNPSENQIGYFTTVNS